MDELNTLILEIYRAARESPANEFQDFVIGLLKATIPFRSAIWGSGQYTHAGVRVHGIHLHNEPLDLLKEWSALSDRDPMARLVASLRNRACAHYVPTVLAGEETAEVLNFAARYGHIHDMHFADMDNSLRGQWLALYRNNPDQHFSAGEIWLMEKVTPHLIEAFAVNRTLAECQTSYYNAGIRALVRTNGALFHCGERFLSLMQEIWPGWISGMLPKEMLHALLAKGRAVYGGGAVTFTASTAGDLLFLQGHRCSPVERLSGRERTVALLYSQGKSYKEIAAHLELSPATVRNFLSRTYKKLQLSNKAELARVFSGHAQQGG